jgi:hypothetical protein
MKTRTLFYTLSLLTAAFTMTACSNDDGATVITNDNANARTWQVSINAGPATTRAISVGGNDGQTLYYNWDDDDAVEVVSEGASVGTLQADASEGNSAYTKLDGTLTGTFNVGDAVTLYYHTAALDYTGQVGTLAGVSTNKSYLTATSTVKAVDGSGGFLTMSDAAFTPMQAYLELSFTQTGGLPLEIKSLEIWTDGGKLVKTKAIDGTTTYASEASPLVITPATATSKMFLALRDENGAANTYHFKATASNRLIYTYEGSKNLENGHYYIGSVLMAPDMTQGIQAGCFLNKDGSITPTKQTSGASMSYAVIAYVGSVPNYCDEFIAIALTDADAEKLSWNNALDKVGTYAAAHPVTIGDKTYNTCAIGDSYYDFFGDGYTSNSRTSAVVKGWRLPSVTDWRYIFYGLYNSPSPTEPTTITEHEGYGNGGALCTAINTACDNNNLNNGGYWTSSSMGFGYFWVYTFSGNEFQSRENSGIDSDNHYVRAVFAY